jgi:geranylgeranyl pyrophosphate synthase
MPMAATLKLTDLQSDRQLIEEELSRVLKGEKPFSGARVFECMEYAVFSGGKRVRPLLGLEVAQVFGARPASRLSSLAAVELVHTASLILDDLPCMDNGTERRGRPAVHIEFGEAIAVLAAFAMVVLSMRLAGAGGEFGAMLLDAIGRNGLISGQEIDLTSGRFSKAAQAKTVPLFELACAAGLGQAAVPFPIRSLVLAFGRSYGRAFQAVNDLLDVGGKEEQARIEILHCTRALESLRRSNRAVGRLQVFVDWLRQYGEEGEARRGDAYASAVRAAGVRIQG